jgi:O-antigen/teichoic acid export membrane protein
VVWRLDPQLVRYLWRESWQLGAAFLVWLIMWRIDQVILYWLRGPKELGQYAVAVKITEALGLISESVMVTVFPLLSSTQVSAPERFRRIYQLTVRYLVVIVLPIALVLTWERHLVLGLLFGAGYAAAGPALVILSWWTFFAYVGAVYVSLMIVRSQQRLIAQVSTVSLVINVVLNLIWVPPWGAAGAAAAMLVTSASSFALFCVAPQSRGIMRVCCDEAVRPLVAVGSAALLLALFVPVALRGIAAVPLYAVLLFLLGGVDRNDWQLARLLWRATPDAK